MIRPGRPFPRSLRWLGLAGTVGVGVFHADLFRQRLVDATIAEPGVALRWLATTLVLLGLGALARRRVSLVRDRRALILWLVALLLHFGATPVVAASPAWLALPAVAAVGFAGAELVALLLVASSGRRLAIPVLTAHAERSVVRSRRSLPLLPAFLPRPPPVRG